MTAPTSTPNAATTTRPERSSRRAARRSPLGWLPWALLGTLAVLLAAVLLIVNAVDDDGPDGPAGDSLGQVSSGGPGIDGEDGDGRIVGTEDESGSTGENTSDAGAGGHASADREATEGTGGASLAAEGEDLLAASGGSLVDRAGEAVTGTAQVESVVSDEGFWVGSSAQERVFVFLTPEARRSNGESGFQVIAGQTVELTGTLTALADAPEAAEGVTSDEGRSQLDAQGAFVSADSVTLA